MVESINHKFLPEVSVIIPIYNGEDDLKELINCLYNQTYPTNKVEYLLINNNSSDRTDILLKEAVIEANEKGFPLVYLTENKIQSSYAARNEGIRKSKYDIIAFTDADCRPNFDWLEKLMQGFTKEEIGILVGEIIALPGDNLLEKYAELKNTLSQKFTLENPFCPYGQTANLAIRKQCFQEIGLFRPYLTTGGDADICWRILRETNWQIQFTPEAIIRHRHRQNIKELKSQWFRYGRSYSYLNQLYNLPLKRNLTSKEISYRLSRWLLKEIPINTWKLINNKSNIIELIKTPIDLICSQSMTKGQKDSILPELAKEIVYLTNH